MDERGRERAKERETPSRKGRRRGAGSSGIRTRREKIETKIEFIGDFDILVAKGINISDGGICFETRECFPFEMKFEWDGELHRRRGKLVWMERLDEGGYRLGFEFVPSEPHPVI